MLTQEEANVILRDLRIRKEFDKVSNEMLQEISHMFDETGIDRQGMFSLILDTVESKVKFTYKSMTGSDVLKEIVIYEHNGFDIYWDRASWEISKREIKDIFFDLKKKMREKKIDKPLTIWQKIKAFIKSLFTF
jgi:hypothetical protein